MKSLPRYFSETLKIVPVPQRKPIVKIQYWPSRQPHGGCYLSISKDGALNFWSERFKLLTTIDLNCCRHSYRLNSHKMWVKDMVCLSNLNLLAISSTRPDVELLGTREIIFCLTGLEAHVLAMDYWTDGKKGIFTIGDMGGCVTVFSSSDITLHGLFNTSALKADKIQISVPILLKNTSEHYQYFKVSLHNEWCRQVRFVSFLRAVASCSNSDQASLALAFLPFSHKKKVRKLSYAVRMGILCFDYSEEMKIFASGGIDRTVRIWDQSNKDRETWKMRGHLKAITDIVINGRDKKIISLSEDKNIRIWETVSYHCVQNFNLRDVNMKDQPVTNIYYNRDTNILVLASLLIGVLQGCKTDAHEKVKTSHKQTLCTALYNTSFKQVVSGCHGGQITVWDVLTGEMAMQFQTSTWGPVQVTAMSFDGTESRLITGSWDGTVQLWNFNTGTLLWTFPVLHASEVTSILYIKERICVSGWSKCIMTYTDVKAELAQLECWVWNCYHSDDIYSMHAYGNSMLATGSYTGDIIIWKVDSREAFLRFNATESWMPLQPVRQERLDPKQKMLKSTAVFGSKCTAKKESFSKEHLYKSRLAVLKVLFLEAQDKRPDTAILLSATAEGFIYAWSVGYQGGLMGRFRATHEEHTFVSTMATDSQNKMLLTGDNRGYIKLWDIEGYCHGVGGQVETEVMWETTAHLPKPSSQCSTMKEPQGAASQQDRVLWLLAHPQEQYGKSISLLSPKLINCWQGHLEGIVNLEYVEDLQFIITASKDCNVRLWTTLGKCIGTFGQDRWCISDTFTSTLEQSEPPESVDFSPVMDISVPADSCIQYKLSRLHSLLAVFDLEPEPLLTSLAPRRKSKSRSVTWRSSNLRGFDLASCVT